MFYHQILLHRRGQFGIIWMEALRSSPYKVTKRQALQVNVRKSCSDILDFVYARLRDERGKRARVSLYLSAHLMYGTVSIWGKQVHILLSDAQEISSRLGLEIAVLESINLRSMPRPDQITLSDPVSRAAGENPFFGSFKYADEGWAEVFEEISSPRALLSPRRDKELSTSEQEVFQPELGSPHTVSSKSEITMKELPIFTSPKAEILIPGELDIPQLNGKELEIMAAPEEDVKLSLQDLLPVKKVSSPSDEQTPEKSTKVAEGRPKGEKKRQRQRKREDKNLEKTQAEELPSPRQAVSVQDVSMELIPIEISPRRPRSRRELFVDANKEMTKDELRHNLTTSYTTCRQFVVPVPTPSTPADLFKQPGSKDLARNPVLLRLWKRNCIESLLETDSDKEIPFWTVPDLTSRDRRLRRVRRLEQVEEEILQVEQEQMLRTEKYPVDDMSLDMRQPAEVPSVEEVREGSLPRSPLTTSLQLSLKEASLSRTRSSRKRSWQEAEMEDERKSISIPEEHLAPYDTSIQLDVLPEEMEEAFSPPSFPDVLVPYKFSPESRFIRQCEREGRNGHYTTFKRVCPTTLTKHQAAKCFMTLLVQCGRGKLFVKQSEPYGEIYISTKRHSLPH